MLLTAILISVLPSSPLLRRVERFLMRVLQRHKFGGRTETCASRRFCVRKRRWITAWTHDLLLETTSAVLQSAAEAMGHV